MAPLSSLLKESTSSPMHEPTRGEMELEERSSLHHVVGLSTELQDITDAEYRELRLEKVVLVGVGTQGAVAQAEAAMAELAALAETAGAAVLDVLIQRRDKPDPATYIGSGKVREVKQVVESLGADTVICDGELSAGQLIALEKAINVKVIDRTALILDIFAQHASSSEGKAQVTLAQMDYMLPRLRGWGDTLSRQAGGRAGSNGGVGLRGPGETKIETDRRRIRHRMAKLRRELAEMKLSRQTKRQRRRAGDTPSIVIVGYTNAGKSSLLNRITGAGVLVQDALFATLDPTTRRAELPDGHSVILTDTVGFVRYLPTQLVEAFRSTLEEVADADIIVHVVDGSDGFPLQQIESVNDVLADVVAEYGIDLPPTVIVINKCDAADPLTLAQLRSEIPDAVFVSAHTGEGMEGFLAALSRLLDERETTVHALIPYDHGELVSRLYEHGRVLNEEHGPDGTTIEARVPRALAQQLELFRV